MIFRMFTLIILFHLILLSGCGVDLEKLRLDPYKISGNIVSVSEIIPLADVGAGGARIKISGSGFTTPMDITIGNNPCTAVSIQGSTEAYCTVPASSSGNTDITVENITITNGIGNTEVLVGAFTYVGDPSMWLDAQGGNYINTGIPSNDDPVTDWVDRSRSPKIVNQLTVGAEPIFKAGDGNGIESIYFDGSARYLIGPAQNLLYTDTTSSILIVFDTGQIPSSGASFAAPALFFNDVAKYGIVLRQDSLVNYNWRSSTQWDAIYSPISIDEGRILATALHANGNLLISKNGSSFNSATSGGTKAGMTATTWIGRGGNNRYYKGHIHEMIFYPIELSNTERAIVENYLNAKWVIY